MLQHLPELVLDLLCDHLSIEDVLVLRSTCKGLREFVDGKQFTILNLFVKKFWFHRRLFYTNEQIGYPHSLHSDDLAILDSIRFRKQFTNVRRMIICRTNPWSKIDENTVEFNLDRLDCFGALNHLEIGESYLIRGKLKSQKLRIASFQMNYQRNRVDSFELNCPELRALEIKQCTPTLTSDTNRLHYFHFGHYGKEDYLKSICSNLQKLSTFSLESIEILLQFLSDLKTDNLSLPELKKISLKEGNRLQYLDELASSLEDLKRDHRTKRIQFTFNGKSIYSPDELRQIASLLRAYNPEPDEIQFHPVWLKTRTLLFLNGNRELEFLISTARIVKLNEDIELSKELIKKIESIDSLEFRDQCKPSYQTFELFSRTYKGLRQLSLYDQKVTERLLEMLANHLVNLEFLRIYQCQYETLKPLTKFKNLEFFDLDFNPPKDELLFLYEKSRTLERVDILGNGAKHIVKLLRTTTAPKLHRISISAPPPLQTIEFNTLHAMIDYYYENGLFENEKIIK